MFSFLGFVKLTAPTGHMITAEMSSEQLVGATNVMFVAQLGKCQSPSDPAVLLMDFISLKGI